jgi:uncharacterized protein
VEREEVIRGPNPASALAAEQRIESIDAIRGVALFGVLMVNLLTIFRISIFEPYAVSAPLGSDWVVEHIVSLVLASKAFCLFSVLFGVGLAIQYERLMPSGRVHYWLMRRLTVLLAFGLAHLLLLWNGDILTEYALAGLVVLPLLALRSPALIRIAAALLALQVAGPLLLYSIPWPDPTSLQAHVDRAHAIYSTASFADVRVFSFRELPLVFWLHVSVFPRTLALFVFGAWLWKTGVLKRPDAFSHNLTTAAWTGIGAGATLTAADLDGTLSSSGLSGWALAELAHVLLALGYGAALLLFLPHAPRVVSAFAPIGRMAFTNYLLQSIVFGFVFFGYGFGQFGRMGTASAFVLGLTVYFIQLAASRWWLRRFRFGPVEWLWRTLMYGFAARMRKGAATQTRA